MARRRVAAGASLGLVILWGVALLLPAAAAATIEGNCLVTGTSTTGGTVDLTSATVWHVSSKDKIKLDASAASAQTAGSAAFNALGFAIPLASGRSDGQTEYHSDYVDVATLAILARNLVLSGSSNGAVEGCSGRVTLVIDDVNPLLTVAGVAGLAATILGVAAGAASLRRPESGRRRLLGVIGIGLLGAGLSVLLQQTSVPGEGDATFAASNFIASVPSPVDVSIDPTVLLQAAVATIVFVLLMPFPAELFNKTLEAHEDEIRAALGRIPLVGRAFGRSGGSEAEQDAGRAPGGRGLVTAAVVVLVSGLLYAVLDPEFGVGVESALTYVGIVLALLAVTWVANLPRRAMQRSENGDSGQLHAVAWTLGIAAACVLISRVTGFLPGYVYGVLLGYQFAKPFDGTREARAVGAGAVWMLALSFVAWLALGAVRTPGIEPGPATAILENVFGAFVVAGIEGIVFGLIPLRFLDGEALFRWQRPRWFVLYALGVFGFFWIILNPANGFVATSAGPELVTAIALFAGFGLASVAFWGYFRIRRAPAPA
jgi:hypothetical protein